MDAKSGRNILMLRVERGCLKDVQECLIKYPSFVNEKNKSGNTALRSAILINNIEIIKELLLFGADVNSRNFSGHTPLYTAVFHGSLEIVQLLLQESADIRISDNKGWTVLMLSVRKGHFEIFQTILRVMSSRNQTQLLFEKNLRGETLFELIPSSVKLSTVTQMILSCCNVDYEELTDQIIFLPIQSPKKPLQKNDNKIQCTPKRSQSASSICQTVQANLNSQERFTPSLEKAKQLNNKTIFDTSVLQTPLKQSSNIHTRGGSSTETTRPASNRESTRNNSNRESLQISVNNNQQITSHFALSAEKVDKQKLLLKTIAEKPEYKQKVFTNKQQISENLKKNFLKGANSRIENDPMRSIDALFLTKNNEELLQIFSQQLINQIPEKIPVLLTKKTKSEIEQHILHFIKELLNNQKLSIIEKISVLTQFSTSVYISWVNVFRLSTQKEQNTSKRTSEFDTFEQLQANDNQTRSKMKSNINLQNFNEQQSFQIQKLQEKSTMIDQIDQDIGNSNHLHHNRVIKKRRFVGTNDFIERLKNSDSSEVKKERREERILKMSEQNNLTKLILNQNSGSNLNRIINKGQQDKSSMSLSSIFNKNTENKEQKVHQKQKFFTQNQQKLNRFLTPRKKLSEIDEVESERQEQSLGQEKMTIQTDPIQINEEKFDLYPYKMKQLISETPSSPEFYQNISLSPKREFSVSPRIIDRSGQEGSINQKDLSISIDRDYLITARELSFSQENPLNDICSDGDKIDQTYPSQDSQDCIFISPARQLSLSPDQEN